jgi:predicted kinase
MPGKLIITRGLPASGKSTWAREFCDWEPGFRVRVNRDDLRRALNGGTRGYAQATEHVVTIAQEASVRALLGADKTVVVDDQNLALRYARKWSRIAYEADAAFEVNDEFLSVPLETCVTWDAQRGPVERVGGDFIAAQYQRYGLKKGLPAVPAYEPPAGLDPTPYFPDTSKPEAIICDLDGTLALLAGRNAYDETRVGEDLVNPAVQSILWNHYAIDDQHGHLNPIIFTSGRSEACRTDTVAWLKNKAGFEIDGFAGHKLFMRRIGDRRSDAEVKLEIFNRYIRNNYNVLYSIDDRDQVVKLWRQLGLVCLQADYGDF